MSGAVDLTECPKASRRVCRCEPCAQCGHGKHTAVHGPILGASPGTRPWGHEYVAPAQKGLSDIVEQAIEAVRRKRKQHDGEIGDGYYEHFPPSADEREELIGEFARVLRGER